MSSIPVRQIDQSSPPERFARGWHCIGLSKTFKNEPVAVEAFGIRIVVYRNTLGEPIVLQATCPHMGGDLCSGKININKKEIQCMVHGYIFSIKTGNFIKNPNIENTLLGRKKNAYFDPAFRENYYLSLKMLDNKIDGKFLVINLP